MAFYFKYIKIFNEIRFFFFSKIQYFLTIDLRCPWIELFELTESVGVESSLKDEAEPV